MTYKRNFVVALKVNGKVLRETGEQVELPFGSEYSVLLKNMNSVRAQAQISIDGTSAGPWYVLGPNESVEIERFNTTGNQDRGNRFKFIERTEAVEEGRGVKLEDGLVRVEFAKEKVFELPKVTEHHTYHHHHDYWWPYRPYVPPVYPKPYWPYNDHITWCSTDSQSSSFQGGQLLAMNNVQSRGLSGSSGSLGAPIHQQNLMKMTNDAGITVAGSESDQKFVNVSGFLTEKSEVLVLKLVGYHGKLKVQKPRTVDQKPRCTTCKKVNKSSAKFCSQCGTSLEII